MYRHGVIKKFFCVAMLATVAVFYAWGADPEPPISGGPETKQATKTPSNSDDWDFDATQKEVDSSEKSKYSDDKKTRNFYEVFEDVLADFEYDLKNGQVRGLKDLSIRNLAVSENIPESFKNHLELLITERIIKNSQGRVIQCLPCRSKRATLSGENMVISSPENNPVELARISKMSGIQYFMDVAFAYQPSGIILSLYISESENGTIIWSASYNSETSRAETFRRGVDYSQIDEARKATEFDPTNQHRLTLYYLFERDVESYTGLLGLGYRIVERYDNRKKEVGFELDYFFKPSLFTGTSPEDADIQSIWGVMNLTLVFLHVWNLIGDVENFNRARGSIFVGIGGTYASGFLGGLIRSGYEWRFAKHWALSLTLGFRPPATAFLPGQEQGVSVSGVEGGIGISALF